MPLPAGVQELMDELRERVERILAAAVARERGRAADALNLSALAHWGRAADLDAVGKQADARAELAKCAALRSAAVRLREGTL